MESHLATEEPKYQAIEAKAEQYARVRKTWYSALIILLAVAFIILSVAFWGELGEPLSWATLLVIGLVSYFTRNWIDPREVYKRDQGGEENHADA